jgi:hypothetical protein
LLQGAEHPGASILSGIDEIRAILGLDEGVWQHLVHTHSSTVATNALIERRGAKIGLLVSAGFRDLFELQRLAIPHPMRFDSRSRWCRARWCASYAAASPPMAARSKHSLVGALLAEEIAIDTRPDSTISGSAKRSGRGAGRS